MFHSTKISGNSISKSNGTETFRKIVSEISVHLLRLSFFLEIWKFQKFPVPFGISTQYESAPVLLAVKSYKMASSLSSRSGTLTIGFDLLVKLPLWKKLTIVE